MTWSRFLREPLLHFVLGGGLLFAVFGLTSGTGLETAADKSIVVTDEALLNFLQYRSQAFQAEYFGAELSRMSDAEREELVAQFVEEEMLYREARALGLEDADYVIRQRLIQKMRFLIDDLVETGGTPTGAALNLYLQKNPEVYTIPPSVTFTHVFLDGSLHGGNAEAMAGRLKAQLNSSGAAFNDAPRHGDRFPFLQNYVERTQDYVASHFGEEFAEALKELAASDKVWHGPLRSMHGYHLVMLTARTEGRMPMLEEIRTQVEEDWLRERTEGARALSLRSLAAQYTIDRRDGGKGK